MPTYLFRCPWCKREKEATAPVHRRDDLDMRCFHGSNDPQEMVPMDRVPARSNFTLKGKGWARDGYTKGEGE